LTKFVDKRGLLKKKAVLGFGWGCWAKCRRMGAGQGFCLQKRRRENGINTDRLD